MRISDWSSDVCSSDLDGADVQVDAERAAVAADIAVEQRAEHAGVERSGQVVEQRAGTAQGHVRGNGLAQHLHAAKDFVKGRLRGLGAENARYSTTVNEKRNKRDLSTLNRRRGVE